MDHAIEAIFQLDESSIARQVADFAFDMSSGWILVERTVPGIDLELADTQRDLLLLAINTEHDRFDFLLLFEHIGGFGDALGPGQFGDMHQTFHAWLQFYKR